MADFRLPRRTGALARQKDIDALAAKVNELSRIAVRSPLYLDRTPNRTVIGLRETRKRFTQPGTKGASGDGVPPGTPFAVVLQQVGGSAGSATASATWTYRVITLDGTVLTDSVNPVGSVHRWRRPSPGRMVPANFGYAHYNASGAFVIGWINEVPEQERCG